jgi:hypothetical protein
METIAVYVNDVDHARHVLQPLAQSQGPTHWVVVACPPRLTRHIGRWVAQAAREQWRERWATEAYAQLEPMLKAGPGNKVEKLLAKRPLTDVTARLQTRLAGVRLLDARQSRLGKPEEPLTVTQPPIEGGRWAYPMAVTTGLSAVLALAD